MGSSRRPLSDPKLAELFASRGQLYAHRYRQTKGSQDLEDVISNIRRAVALAEETQPGIPGPALGNLAALSWERSKAKGKIDDLNEARQLATWALERLPNGDTNHALVLNTLGIILTTQYGRCGRSRDLEEAVFSLQLATQSCASSEESLLSAIVLSNLACALGKRYESDGRREDLIDAITTALEGTKLGLLSNPSLMAGTGSNLAGLLVKQFRSTGNLSSLADALFELRIVLEMAPKDTGLDILLDQLGNLAMEEHTLRKQATDTRIKTAHPLLLQRLSPYLFLLLLTLLPIFSPIAFIPILMFIAGFVSNRSFRSKCFHSGTRRITRIDLLLLIPNSILGTFPWLDKTTDFMPTLFPSPWIETLPTLASLKSKDETYNREIRHQEMHTIRLDSKYDHETRNRAIGQFPADGRESIQKDADALTGFIEKPSTSILNANPENDSFSNINCSEDKLKSQIQFRHDSQTYADVNDSRSDNDILSVSEDAEGANPADGKVEDGPDTENPIPATGHDIANPMKSNEIVGGTEEILEALAVMTGASSKQASAGRLSPDDKNDQPKSTKRVQGDASENKDKSLPTVLSSPDTNYEAPPTQNETVLAEEDAQPIKGTQSNPGNDVMDQNVFSRAPPAKLDKEPSKIDSVTNGNTLNDMHTNEGNAMGNIYSEEAHVVGHLSRHYGNISETKNISAFLPWSQNLDADQNPIDASSFDKPHTESISRKSSRIVSKTLPEVPQIVIGKLPEPHAEISTQEHGQNAASHTRLGRLGRRATKSRREKKAASKFGQELLKAEAERYIGPHPSPQHPRPGPSGARREESVRKTKSQNALDDPEPNLGSAIDTEIWGRSYFNYPAVESKAKQEMKGPKESNTNARSEVVIPPGAHPAEDRRDIPSHNVRSSFTTQPLSTSAKIKEYQNQIHRATQPTRLRSRERARSLGDTSSDLGFPPPPPIDHEGTHYLQGPAKVLGRNMYPPHIFSVEYVPPTPPKTNTEALAHKQGAKDTTLSLPPALDFRFARSPYEEVGVLASYFQQNLLPLCDEYLRNPPADPKVRELRHRQLCETIMTQVLLRADRIEPRDGETREWRRDLVQDAQWTLESLDATLHAVQL